MNLKRTAQCCCGELSISVTGEPEMNGICHCDNCKRRTGSAFGMSSYFKASKVTAMSPTEGHYKFHHKGQNHDQDRAFCTQCGTTVYWHISTFPDLVGIASGCFVDEPLPNPNYSANHRGKCQWLTLEKQINPDN